MSSGRSRRRYRTKAASRSCTAISAPDGAVIKQIGRLAGPAAASRQSVRLRKSRRHGGADRSGLDLPIDRNTHSGDEELRPEGRARISRNGAGFRCRRMLLRQGINDVVRISDARMSGTSFGTVVLHVAPESAIGGPLSLVQTGDEIDLDVHARTLNVNISAGGVGSALESIRAAQAALHARVRAAVLGARDASRQGLRLRFSGTRFRLADLGGGNAHQSSAQVEKGIEVRGLGDEAVGSKLFGRLAVAGRIR